MSLAVRLANVTKRFGSVVALDDVGLEVETGTMHAVVGENGAGKSTLMRVLYGASPADSGTVEVDGVRRDFRKSSEAIAAGVGMVSQHYGIVPELTCLQNLMLGAESGLIIDYSRARRRADELATRLGFEFDWSAEASTLSPAGAQKLEILKLLWRNSRVMILDEPTAMLSPADGEALFESLSKLVRDGATVILVTHRLPEVMNFCKRVTVLRGGRWIADKAVKDTSSTELAELIVGGAIDAVPASAITSSKTMLEIRGLSVRSDRGVDALKSVDLVAKEGEIVGIAGVDGSGQRELIQAIVGLAPIASGSIKLGGEDITLRSTMDRYELGVRLIAEDRHREAVIESWSLEENAALGLQRLAPIGVGGRVATAARSQAAAAMAARFKTKHGGLGLSMSSLSGGNQQRFVAGRALWLNPKLVLAFQPARGLDLKGAADVYRGIREAVDLGAAAIVVSFDLDELLEFCDRAVAMCGGRLSEPPRGMEKDRAVIGRLMVGAE